MSGSYVRALRQRIGHDLLLLPAVAASILDQGGRLLLQEKASGEGWSLPAGGVEPGETPREAIVREIEEETGWRARVDGILDVCGGPAFRHTYPNGDSVEFAVTLFRCTVIGGDGVPRDPET